MNWAQEVTVFLIVQRCRLGLCIEGAIQTFSTDWSNRFGVRDSGSEQVSAAAVTSITAIQEYAALLTSRAWSIRHAASRRRQRRLEQCHWRVALSCIDYTRLCSTLHPTSRHARRQAVAVSLYRDPSFTRVRPSDRPHAPRFMNKWQRKQAPYDVTVCSHKSHCYVAVFRAMIRTTNRPYKKSELMLMRRSTASV